MIETFDKQLGKLPKKIKFCKNCVVSNQRPRTDFNSEGVCSACEWSYEKNFKVDWKQREEELKNLLAKHRKSNGEFDVIVPSSGAKDSAFVAHTLKYKYNMNPLTVTWSPMLYTDIGFKNLRKMIDSGLDNILGTPDGKTHRTLTKLSLEIMGDLFQPFIYCPFFC